ncbi:MAG TPA: TIGR03118 family protein [Solirubrobacter sp.]|nr:TIGR03118 family protein [Solirubrobacter sp.]
MHSRGLVAGAVLASLALAAPAAAAPSDTYVVRNLVSNDTAIVPADRADPHLVNPWGLASSATSPWWPANQRDDTSTIIPATGAVNNLVVPVPSPTGIVAGAGEGTFPVGTPANASNFIFASMDGTIYSWRGGLPGNIALASYTSPDGAVYMGLAKAGTGTGTRLYAADLKHNRVDVVDAQWQFDAARSAAFVDPDLPAGYAPYGIQAAGDRIFVTYAKQPPGNPSPYREIPGAGSGVVNAFDFDGHFVARVASPGGVLNAPWGTALADPNFGLYGGDLLIGNFGDGRINAFHENADGTWTQSGSLKDLSGRPLAINGLWALQFGSGTANNGQRNHLYFTAGPFGETAGLFGRIVPNPSEAGGTVPATLSLTLGAPASFGAFAPGVGQDYSASTTANVISTAGDATLSVADPSAGHTGRLVNGAFALTEPLRVSAASAGGTSAPAAPVGGAGAPTTVLTYDGPISNDAVTVDFTQTVLEDEPLRTGTYAKTLTFTLSTTSP